MIEPIPPLLAETIPLRGARGVIARRMTASLHDSAQLTLHSTAPCSGLFAVHAALRRHSEELRPSFSDLLLFAVVHALQLHPALNATIDETAIHRWLSINVGFAVALDDGLVVPVMRNCENRGLGELTAEARALVEKARNGRLSLADISDGTFTISNLGTFGVDHFTPIINPPQVAILGVGRAIAERVSFSLTIDHRAIDGAVGGRFLLTLSDAVDSMELVDAAISWR